jgi:hypothetical protein
MPFTISHAAAVWPFNRTRLVMSGLIAGCFAPDFAYFFFISNRGLFAHSLPGMFLVDLPLSLIALWLFYTFIKKPFTLFLPKGFRARMKPDEDGFSFWPPARLARIVVSILVGTATHILWDSFTHPFYWPYRHLSFLRLALYLPVEGHVPLYKALQDASSLGGLALVAVWIWVWYRAAEPHKLPAEKPYTRAQILIIRIVVPAVALIGGAIKSHNDTGMPDVGFRPILHFTVIGGIAATTFFMVGLLICGMVFSRRVAVMEPA